MNSISALAASITKSASRQTWYTIRFLVDRQRVEQAYLAYAYFRWVDDHLDSVSSSGSERGDFIQRQESLQASCLRGESIRSHIPQEQMIIALLGGDPDGQGGLRSYFQNMMMVMAFDVERRGRLISQSELNTYTHWLAVAVTEAMHHFIGHDCPSPRDETRALAVTAAHIVHMLRDTFDDLRSGYFNIPLEVLEAHHITPRDVDSPAYRAWVQSRVKLARACFKSGNDYLNRVASLRCRLAGHAYRLRFETLLDTIQRDGFFLRPAYEEPGALSSGWGALSSALFLAKGSLWPVQPHPEGRP